MLVNLRNAGGRVCFMRAYLFFGFLSAAVTAAIITSAPKRVEVCRTYVRHGDEYTQCRLFEATDTKRIEAFKNRR